MNKYQKIAKATFNNLEGEPFELTEGQSEIFRMVYEPAVKRGAIKTTTQYGKSDVTSMALITALMERNERALIVAPRTEQAQIIMGYFIQHLFDNPLITKALEYEGNIERLRRERSKKRITFRHGSEVRVLTADVRTLSKEGKGLMGFGASLVIADESALIPDNLFSKILRMVGGVKNGKIVKLGNPFERNHFYRSLLSPRYEHLSIDYKQAIKEGRLTKEFVEEAREDMPPMDFKIFYECEFPEGGAEDSLIPLDWIELSSAQDGFASLGKKTAGLDVARFGRDKTVYILRDGGVVKRIETTEQMDTMQVVGWVKKFLDEDKPDNLNVDVVGIGAGVYDRLEEMGYSVTPVNVGEKPIKYGELNEDEAKNKFFNLRAQVYWNLRDLLRPEDGKSKIEIGNHAQMKRELSEIRYKYSSERKVRIEDKEEMKRRLGNSPDYADALALAYFELTKQRIEFMMY